MCGINGFVGRDERLLEEMNAKLRHRGPDYAGAWFDAGASLGHVLLSIRDAADVSRQPYRKEGSPWVLLFNGQIYNTRQLKTLLPASFKDFDLDTAVLYGLIEKEGWGFIERIHGMYAIALYNADEKVVRLYRDPSGQKNLYWYLKDGRFIWSSEIKGILSHPGIDRSVDAEAIVIAANLGYIPGEKTLFEHIRKLDPSQEVSYDVRKGTLEKRHFMTPSEGYYPDDPDAAFRQLIEEHLQSKQKVAINLSGGLDSSLLVHEMSRLGHEVHTYTDRFACKDPKFNIDADLAARLAKDYGAVHTEIPVTAESYLERLVDAYRLIEEPNYNISLPAYLQTAQKEGISGDGNRVILSGDGGDELFGGYPHYHETARMESRRRLLTPWVYDFLKNRNRRDRYDYGRAEERWLSFRRFNKRRLLRDWDGLVPYVKASVDPYLERYAAKRDPIYQTMLMDRIIWMGGENFIRSDKLFMSQSVELRSPLSYHPFRMHMDRTLGRKDYVGEGLNKKFLRRHYAGKLPDYIVMRSDKTGWRSPLQEWWDVRFRDLYLDAISSVRPGGIVDWEAVKGMIAKSEGWPGKEVQLYLSLAILAKEYGIAL